MDMELQPVVLVGYRQVLDTAVTQEETLESIVPDTYPAHSPAHTPAPPP